MFICCSQKAQSALRAGPGAAFHAVTWGPRPKQGQPFETRGLSGRPGSVKRPLWARPGEERTVPRRRSPELCGVPRPEAEGGVSDPASGFSSLTPHFADGHRGKARGARSVVLWGDCVSFQVLRLALRQAPRDLVATASTYEIPVCRPTARGSAVDTQSLAERSRNWAAME